MAEAQTIKVPVTKGKGFIEINPAEIPQNVWNELVLQGAKVLLNRGQSKITSTTYPDEKERAKAAMDKAEETKKELLAGKVRVSGGKAKGASGAVMTEARRIAKNILKAQLKAEGVKVSYIEASELTKAANTYIAENPDVLKQAEESLANAKKGADKAAESLKALVSSIPISDKKKAKAEAEKAKAKQQLSAKQAGKPAKARPQANA